MQVGYVGLVAAINNFDPAVGCSLATYARSHIDGEIRRHFRDRANHVVRPVKELAIRARPATWQLAQELGRTPTESDLAAFLGVSGHELRDAQLAEMTFQPTSLDAPLAGRPDAAMLADLLGEDDPQVDHMLCMQALATHWGELPSREQKILLMRFYGGLTQTRSASSWHLPDAGLPPARPRAPLSPARAYSGLTSAQPQARAACGPQTDPDAHPGGISAWLSGTLRGSAHHRAQRHHRRAPPAACGGWRADACGRARS